MLPEDFEEDGQSRMKILADCLNVMTKIKENGGTVNGEISERDRGYCSLLCRSSPPLLESYVGGFRFTGAGRKFYEDCYGR